MRTVIAALDSSAAVRPVLETARRFAQLTDATVEAVHVGNGLLEATRLAAEHAGVPFRVVGGPVEAALLDAMRDAAVIAAVLGARGTPGGRRPVGHTTIQILERASKPVVVVPPEAVGVSPVPFRRLLVPLEGTESSSRPVAEDFFPLIVGDVELVVLHVFTEDTMPRILDRPGRDFQLLGGEFLARYCPDATRIELRSGPVGLQVAEVCAEEGADLVVLSWSQDTSPGRANVIREVLSHSTIPVLVLPVDDAHVVDLDAFSVPQGSEVSPFARASKESP